MRSIVSRCAALLSGAFLLMNSVPAAFAEEPNTIVQKEAHTMQTYRQMLTELAPDAVFARQEGVSYPTFQKYTYYSRDRKSTRLNSSHANESRMPSSA